MYVEEGEKKSHLSSETQVSVLMCRRTANHRQRSVLWGSRSFRIITNFVRRDKNSAAILPGDTFVIAQHYKCKMRLI